MNEPLRIQRVGRLEIAFPVAFQEMLREGSLLGSEIKELGLPDAASKEKGFESLRQERLASSRKDPTVPYPFRLVKEEILGPQGRIFEMEMEVSADDARTAPKKHVAEALVTTGSVAVSIRHTWFSEVPGLPSTPQGESDRQEGMKSFRSVVAAVRSLAATSGASSDPTWYYLPRAAFAVSPAEVARGADENESTYINLEDPSRRFIFSLRSAYPWSPDREGDRGLISGFVEAVLGLGAGYSSVRAVKRTVAGFGGEEAIIHDKERGTLAFTWARDPVRGTGGYSPNLRLDMRAPDEQREAALAVWDAILGSIRPLPPR